MGRTWKRWIDTVKECLKKLGLNVKKVRRVVHDRSVLSGGYEGECVGCNSLDDHLDLTRCHRCEFPQLYEALEGQKPVCDQAHN